MNIILLTPSRRFIANRMGLGYQIPLGLIFIGGPLIDAGHQVQLIDNDVLGWTDKQLVAALKCKQPDCIMLGHSSSTASHTTAMRTAKILRKAFPQVHLIYGGTYPTYAAQKILEENICLDIIVHGEGEATVIELTEVLSFCGKNLRQVKGITWRENSKIRTNSRRKPITDLDQFRPGWELVDWSKYKMFGFGTSAGMQFSRGCPLTCTYCGQWGFWRKWRHRSPENFVNQLEILEHDYGVNLVWLADENFAADRESARNVLQCIVARKLELSINLNMTAADVVRDADLLPLYKQAGVDNIILGIEFLNDSSVKKVRKNNPYSVSCEAIKLLREHDIVSLVNIIYGIESENLSSLLHTFKCLFKLDPDILNAVYITPHHWTPDGYKVTSNQIIQKNQHYWTYRNQVLSTPQLRPWQLFTAIKLTEALFHLRPIALLRMLFSFDKRYQKILRAYLKVGFKVFVAEIYEFVFIVSHSKVGFLKKIPGFPIKKRHSRHS